MNVKGTVRPESQVKSCSLTFHQHGGRRWWPDCSFNFLSSVKEQQRLFSHSKVFESEKIFSARCNIWNTEYNEWCLHTVVFSSFLWTVSVLAALWPGFSPSASQNAVTLHLSVFLSLPQLKASLSFCSFSFSVVGAAVWNLPRLYCAEIRKQPGEDELSDRSAAGRRGSWDLLYFPLLRLLLSVLHCLLSEVLHHWLSLSPSSQ